MTTMRTQVEQTIEVIRPALHADGGDIELVEVDEPTGIVYVKLVGACGTCPTSTVTLKAGIERIMRDRIDGVTEVVNVSPVDDIDGSATGLPGGEPARVSPFAPGGGASGTPA